MELLLGALLCVPLLGLVVVLLGVNASAWRRLRQTPSRPIDGESPYSGDGPPATHRFDYIARGPTGGREAHWNPYGAKETRGSPKDVRYRVHREAGDGAKSRWDPFAPDQAVTERIRAARHNPAPRPVADTHYALLGISLDASESEIMAAYRRHAAMIHPDKFFADPQRRYLAEEKLKQLNQAMQILRDPRRRAQYDASLVYSRSHRRQNAD